MNHRFATMSFAAALVFATSTHGQDLPRRAPGLWETTVEMQGLPQGMKSQQCVDDKTDAEMQRKAMAGDPQARCTQKSMKRVAGGYEMEAECVSSQGKSYMVSRATGDFGKSYTVDNRVRFDPPRHGMRESAMTIKATHQGDCPKGMLPGQTRMAGMPAMEPGAMKGMSPEQMRRMAEELKKASGK